MSAQSSYIIRVQDFGFRGRGFRDSTLVSWL